MKKAILTWMFLSLLCVGTGYGQCKTFAKNSCKTLLGQYQHDGNYHAAVLTEGEEAELFKTFYADTDYCMSICYSNTLDKIHFKVLDDNNNVLFDNAKSNFSGTWKFRMTAAQQLKIIIGVPARPNVSSPADLASGCVSVMFGFLNN